MRKKVHAAILLSLLMVVPRVTCGASPEDQFNLERLKSGQNLYLEKRYLDAIAQLHVAAFGYLSKPAPLSECLVWLTLAQTGAGRAGDADATIARFLEIERRFPSYPAASLPPEIRADFRKLLERRVDAAVLASIPSLAPVVETKEQKFAKLPPAAPSAKPAPKTVSSTVAASATARPAPAPPPPPAPTKAPAPGPTSASVAAGSEAALAQSRRLVASGKAGDAERILTDAVKSDPSNRDLRLALLEAACLTRSYKTGMAQIAVLEPFGEVEAPSMFYAAVVLYDSGHPKEARTYLERSAQKVSGPLVDEYSKKILGPN